MRVLIAENDASTRHLLRRLFTDWGHSVVLACDADEAWARADNELPPQILLLDRGLARGGGLSICRRLAQSPRRGKMHVFLAMALMDSQSVANAFAAGADDVISKPFDLDDLRRRVDQAVIELGAGAGAGAGAAPAAAPHPVAGSSASERQQAALARLGRQATTGASYAELARAAMHEITTILAAESVQLVERVSAGGAHELAVGIGAGAGPQRMLLVKLPPPRRVETGEAEFVRSICHLIELCGDRERLELQLQQAQKMDTFGHLAGGIAHDFNNLLAVIGSVAATVAADDDGPLAAEMALIHQAVERGRALAGRLLGFSRLPTLERPPLDLNQTMFEARAMLERLLVGRIGIATDLDPGPLVIRADRGEVEQVLINLVLNARDASPPGAVVVVRTGHSVLAGQAGMAYFSVSDTGSGMDDNVRARMFDAFFTTKPAGQGTGLGLSTVKEIVRRAEGKIKVESALERGTTITVYWPCAGAACCEPLAPQPGAAA